MMRNERSGVAHATHRDFAVAAPWSRYERMLLALICTATLFFALVTPPFQAPDENQHYMKALLLSEGQMLVDIRDGATGADLPRGAIDLHRMDFPTELPPAERRFDTNMLASAWTADAGRAGTIFATFPNVANYAPTLYAPGAAGLLIGDVLGLPHLGSFFVGRLMNALAALAMLALALRCIPFGRMAMLACALLPTFSYQTGSLSPDAVINGIGFLGLALALRVGFMGKMSKALWLVAPLLALAKGVYLPLMAAGLRWQDRREGRFWLILAAMLVGAAVFVGWMRYSGGSQTLYHIMSRKTGQSVMTAPLADQLAVILNDPVGYVRILLTSMAERAPVYALQIVGRFGWNAILMPLLAYPLAAVMLGAAVMNGVGVRFSLAQRLWWIAIVIGTAVLIETAMYLTGTPPGADFIQGTQGRYFLPLLPLALIALSPDRAVRGARTVFAASALLLLLIAMVTVWDSFWIHGFITSDGMPPHQSLGRALLLPSPRW